MACQTSAGVASYENCGVGISPGAIPLATYSSNDPNTAAIKAAVASSTPAGAPHDYAVAAEACLRAGGILYWQSNYVPCGSNPSVPGITSGQIVGLSGSAASGVVGGLGAAGIIGGAATLGISAAVALAVGGIEYVFAHHTQAVANEQATICQVAVYFNQAKQKIDAAVRSGAITPGEGVAYFTQVANQAKSGLQGIMQKCNAACVYQGICQAFLNYSVTWYDSISPVNYGAQAPGGPPTYYGTPPGGVTTSPGIQPPPQPVRSLPGNTYLPAGPSPIPNQLPSPPISSNNLLPGNPYASDYLNRGYNQPTGQAAQGADTVNTFVMPSWLIPLAAIVLVVLVLMRVF